METDNTIMAQRDHAALREEFLNGLEDAKVRAAIEELGPYPYYLPQLFPTTKGWGVRRQVRNRVKIIRAIEPSLKALLFPNEEVRFVCRGIFYSFGEQYLLGIFSHLVNQTVFIFTNFRVIMLNVNSRNVPRHMKWHIAYDQMLKFSSSFFSGAAIFKLKDKKKYTFTGMSKQDKAIVKEYVAEMIVRTKTEKFHMPQYQSRDNLCSNCCKPVPAKQYTCPLCSQEFITPWKPAVMSLVLPCLGDFYLGHTFLGVIELLVYVFTWFVLIGIIAEEGVGALPIVAVILLVEHGLDSLLTLQMAKKGLTPATAGPPVMAPQEDTPG
jgi:hypothetical protein